MEFDISHRPSYALLEVTLDAGETLGAKQGAMVSRSAHVSADTTTGGGGVTGMLSRAISDEHEVLSNVFEAETDGQHVALAPDHPGDVVALDLAETGRVKVQSGSALAWGDGVEKSTAVNEASNFFSSGELTVLALDGTGTAFLSAYGAVHRVPVSAADPVVVDEDHLLAWTDGLSANRQRDGSIKSTLLGGEGFVTRFEGEGDVWLQTRDPVVFMAQTDG